MPRFAANSVVTGRNGRLATDLSNDFSGRDQDEDSVSGFESTFDGEGSVDGTHVASERMKKEIVFPLVMRVRQEAIQMIDTPLSLEQFRSPAINFSVVRPLMLRLARNGKPSPALIWALLANRSNFLDESENDLAFMALNASRADLCELLAIKLLSAYNAGSNELLHVLTMPFSPFRGATSDMFAEEESISKQDLENLLKWSDEECTNAIELAIYTQAKRFVKSPLVQQIISAIYVGDLTYNPVSTRALISDSYKTKPIVEVYDWRKQAFLDHNRLRVPAIRTRLDLLTFAMILVLFLIAQGTRNYEHINVWEGLFIFFSLGFALDEYASIAENGIRPYLVGSYNVLDSLFCIIFFAFLALRISGITTGHLDTSKLAFDTLALAACVLFPRMSISLVRGNVVLLALSSMITEYVLFMGLSILTASGFLCALRILSEGTWGIGRLAWLMFKIFSGSSYLGYEVAQEFHPVFGPILIVLFSVLSSTLLVTILISLLSNTFALIQQNSETEILYQKALRTIERAKTDALSSYFPPLNLLALFILALIKPLVSPRYFHKINVATVRAFNFPILFFLAIDIRLRNSKRFSALRLSESTQKAWRSFPRGIGWDGAADHVHEVFKRQTTEQALAVPEMDPFQHDGAGSSDSKNNGKASTATETDSPAAPSSTTTQTPTKAPQPASKAINPRLGTLGSPLARMFTMRSGETTTETGNDSKKSALMTASANERSAFVSGDVIRRLEAIESALAFLVGEVTKAPGGDPSKNDDVPLTSLTGKREESYKDE